LPIEAFITQPESGVQDPGISELFWEVYEKCYIKVAEKELKDFIPGIMLYMGVVDERLLTVDELSAIKTFLFLMIFL